MPVGRSGLAPCVGPGTWVLCGHWQYALSAPCVLCDHTICTGGMGTSSLRAVCMMSGRVGVMRVGAVVSSVCRNELSQLDGGVREPLSSRFCARQSRASCSRARRVVLSRQKGSRRRRRLLDSHFFWRSRMLRKSGGTATMCRRAARARAPPRRAPRLHTLKP